MIDTDNITYREIAGRHATQDEWDRIDAILAARNWMSLNRETSYLILAEDEDNKIVGLFVFQLVPHAGPMWVRPELRGTAVPWKLVERMTAFFARSAARGVVIVADNPATAKMCETIGMTKVNSPVYVLPGAEV